MNALKEINKSERLFAELCIRKFLKGFVYHSPKCYDPTEREVGDVVLWVRLFLIVFEIIWRDNKLGTNPRRFIQRIGEKREQLISDFKAFKNGNKKKLMINENRERMEYDNQYFSDKSFCGVIIIDSDIPIGRMHFETMKKSLIQDFPIAIFTKNDFIYLTKEIDTIPDLAYYLHDRYGFLKKIFAEDTDFFLNLDIRTEKNLIAFYKMNEYELDYNKWQELKMTDIWDNYREHYKEKIQARDRENRDSFRVDELIDLLRNITSQGMNTLQHAFELASTTRRYRSQLAATLNDAFEKMAKGKRERFFSIENKITQCWQLFYFQYGGSYENFKKKVIELTRLKLIYRMKTDGFKYAVFAYAFRKTEKVTGNESDSYFFFVDDARDTTISEDKYRKSLEYFSGDIRKRISEFPEN